MLYHITEKLNESSILNNGLLRKEHAFICLCENPSSWIGMFEMPCIFKVDIDAYMCDNPNITVTTWQPQSDEICVWGDIPPKYISVSKKSSEIS